MPAKRLLWQLPPALVAAGVAALWPLTAYAFHPIVLPSLLAFAAATAVALQRPEYGLALALAGAPFLNVIVGGGQPLQLLVPALVFAVALYALLVRPGGDVGPLFLPASVVVFVAAGVAASLQALDPAESPGRVFRLLTAAALFFAVLHVCRERRQLVVVAVGAVVALLLASLHGLAQHYAGFSTEFSFVSDGAIVERVQGAFGHPNEYAGFVAVLMPLAAVLAVSRAFSSRVRALSAVTLVAALPALNYSYARGAVVAVALGSIIWVAVVRPRLAVVVAAVVAVVAVTLLPPALKQRFESEGRSGDVTLRADIWSAALEIYSEHPLLGVGLNNFATAYEALPTVLGDATQRRLLHTSQLLVPPYAENLYLNILAEEGTVGFAAFLLLALAAAATLYRGAHSRDPAARAIALGVGAGVMTLAVHGLLQVTLFTELALPLFALLGVAARIVTLDDEPAT